MSPTQLGKPFGYPIGKPHKPVSDTPFILAVFGLGVLIGACAAIVVVLGWMS